MDIGRSSLRDVSMMHTGLVTEGDIPFTRRYHLKPELRLPVLYIFTDSGDIAAGGASFWQTMGLFMIVSLQHLRIGARDQRPL